MIRRKPRIPRSEIFRAYSECCDKSPNAYLFRCDYDDKTKPNTY